MYALFVWLLFAAAIVASLWAIWATIATRIEYMKLLIMSFILSTPLPLERNHSPKYED